MKEVYYYTVYLKKDDEIVVSGTARECARYMNKSLNGFHSMVSKNTLGVENKYTVLKEKVLMDDDGNICDEDEQA